MVTTTVTYIGAAVCRRRAAKSAGAAKQRRAMCGGRTAGGGGSEGNIEYGEVVNIEGNEDGSDDGRELEISGAMSVRHTVGGARAATPHGVVGFDGSALFARMCSYRGHCTHESGCEHWR